jgi:hypothetical protein
MASLAEIRAKLKEQELRGSDNNQRSGGDNSIYPFWNLKEGQEAFYPMVTLITHFSG